MCFSVNDLLLVLERDVKVVLDDAEKQALAEARRPEEMEAPQSVVRVHFSQELRAVRIEYIANADIFKILHSIRIHIPHALGGGQTKEINRR